MSRFMKPDFGNTKRIGSPLNRIKNLTKKFNKQRRDKKDAKS